MESSVAQIVPSDSAMRALFENYVGTESLLGRVLNKPNGLFAMDERWNTRPYHAAEIPSSNGVCSARALARMYAATIGVVDGIRLLEPATIDEARREHSAGIDTVLGVPTRFGLGFSLPPVLCPHGADGAFGHAGAGGSLASPIRRTAWRLRT